MRSVTLLVTGTVQGVFFRHHTEEKAKELKLHGFVKNMDDGSVMIEAEGDSQAVQAMIDWARRGPPKAKVERVQVVEGEVRGHQEFQIR